MFTQDFTMQDFKRVMWFLLATLMFMGTAIIVLVIIPAYTYFKMFFFMVGAG